MKRKAMTTIMLILFLVGLCSVAFNIAPVLGRSGNIAEVNLIKNPGFEDRLKFWSVSTGTATYSADNAVSHSGSYSAKGVEIDIGSLGRLYQDVTDLVKPGKQYRISGWIKTQDVTGHVVIGLDYVDSNGWTPADGYVKEIGYVTDSTDWTYFESDVFTLPPMPTDATAIWFLFDFNNGKGTAWWDDVSLIEIPRFAFHFRAWIDGSDWVHIRGNEVWYVHRNYQYPGIHPPCPPEGHPTYINGDPWYPEWPDDWGYDDYGQRSLNTYTNLYPPLLKIVSLTVIEARYSISIVQYPSIQNDYTAIILLDDDPPGGAAWYEFELTYTSLISATIDIDPDTLNLKSKGKWVTSYVELPEGYDVSDIDISTILMDGVIPAEQHPTEIGDYDGDGKPDLMVKFDRQDLISLLEGESGEVESYVRGTLFDGTPFEGSDTIRVISKGKS